MAPATLSLVEDATGILRLELPLGPQPAMLPGPRARAGASPAGAEHLDLHFDPFPPNQLTQVLRHFDRGRFVVEGLCQVVVDDGKLALRRVEQRLPSLDRALVIVHGTASSAEHLVAEIHTSGAWPWVHSLAASGHLFAFNHATLSVPPLLNAIDLEDALASNLPNARVDLLCHSRGGLVSRWWAEVLGDRRAPERVGTVVFVGAPLDGTSLAAPAALKGYVEHLVNTLRAVQTVGSVAGTLLPALQPILATVGILARVIATGMSVGSKTPLLDVALAAIPGLAAMSRIEGNEELERLSGRSGRGLSGLKTQAWYDEHFRFVCADYEPKDPGLRIWRYLTDSPVVRVVDGVMDRVFPGRNDLVVDTDSMFRLRPDSVFTPGPGTCLTCGDRAVVHHVNYFQQPEVSQQVAAWLGF